MIRLNNYFYASHHMPPWGNVEVCSSSVGADKKCTDKELFAALKAGYFTNGRLYYYGDEAAKAYSESTLGNYQSELINFEAFEKVSYAVFITTIKDICNKYSEGVHSVYYDKIQAFVDVFFHLLKMEVPVDATIYFLHGKGVPTVMPDGTGFYKGFDYFFIIGSMVASDLKAYQTITTIKVEKE